MVLKVKDRRAYVPKESPKDKYLGVKTGEYYKSLELVREKQAKDEYVMESLRDLMNIAQSTTGIVNIRGEELQYESGSSNDFFVRRIFDEVRDINRSLEIIEGSLDKPELINRAFEDPSEDDDDDVIYIRNFMYEFMVDHPDMYMMAKSLYSPFETYTSDLSNEDRLIRNVAGPNEDLEYLNNVLRDNALTGEDIRNIIREKREREEEEAEENGEEPPYKKRFRLRAPRTDDPEIKRLYNHLCFYLEPVHDFTSARHKDEGEAKIMSAANRDFLMKNMGKFTKDVHYLNEFYENLAPEKNTKFRINGNVRDFSNKEELDTLLKTIDVLGKDKSSRTIKFTTPVVKVTEKTKGVVAEFDDTKYTVRDIIGMFATYFGNRRVFRDAKGTTLIGHLESSNQEIAKLNGSKNFAEKLFDGNGPNKLSDRDVLKTDYIKQVFNAPSVYATEVAKHYTMSKTPYILTQPQMTNKGDQIFPYQTRKFVIKDGTKEIEFGPSVKEMSMIMKYYMNKKNYEMFWVMLNLKRSGDHGQAERAYEEGGVFETLDHLAAAYAIMIDVPTIFTYSDKKQNIIGDFILTGVDLYISDVLIMISEFINAKGELIEGLLNSVLPNGSIMRETLRDVVSRYEDSRAESIDSIQNEAEKTLLLNYYELCSTLIQFVKYLEENKKQLTNLFDKSVGKFTTLLRSVSSRSRTDQQPPFKVLLDGMMTLSNFTKYKKVIRSFTSLMVKIFNISVQLNVTEAIRGIIDRVYMECVGIGKLTSRADIISYFNNIRDSVLTLMTPINYAKTGDWRSAIIQKLSLDNWLKEETTETLAANFTELIDLYNKLYE